MKFDDKFLDSSTHFTGQLYQHAIEGVDGNVVFSPICVLTALSFLMFGASGKTFSQMKSSLKFDGIPNEDLEKNFQQLTKSLKTRGNGLSVANKVFVKENYSIKPKFIEIASKSFHSEVQTINFEKKADAARTINQWVESRTNNKIKNLIKSDNIDSDTNLVLTNVVYFKTEWKRPFNQRQNFKGPFYKNKHDSVDLEYMSQKNIFHFGRVDDLDATITLLRYKDSKVSMIFILPNSRTGLSSIEKKLNETNINDLVKRMSRREIQLIIPKFKIEFDIDLKDPLKKMGMDTIFSNSAEFNNLLDPVEPLKVSKVIHKAVIEISEKQSESGGGTGMATSKHSRQTYFRADRPFMFALMENSKCLFIGRKVQ